MLFIVIPCTNQAFEGEPFELFSRCGHIWGVKGSRVSALMPPFQKD